MLRQGSRLASAAFRQSNLVMAADEPLPDPVAYARGLTEQELFAYRSIYGEQSREWIIAQDELRRRRWPVWRRVLCGLVCLTAIALLVWRSANGIWGRWV